MTLVAEGTVKRRRVKPAATRFYAKVDRRGPDDCWLWLAGKSNGYGSFRPDSTSPPVSAHSFAKLLATGVACPPGLEAQHTCKTRHSPLCCNPAHIVYGPPGAVSTALRGKNPSTKLTDQDVRDIVRRVRAGETQTAVADAYGIRQPYVSALVLGRARPHVHHTP